MTVSVALINPKFPHNVGAAIRAMSCFGEGEVMFTGDRIDVDKLKRLPREERMKAYNDVKWRQSERIFDENPGLKPVAIELLPGTQMLQNFVHPENVLYVFGPEDGSLPRGVRVDCHEFVAIPSKHCLNLAAAVYLVLYDRLYKRWLNGEGEMPALDEDRSMGWWHSPSMEEGSLGE